MSSLGIVHLVDYGAGNARSVRNAIVKCGYEVVDARNGKDLAGARAVVFPGVGAFGSAMRSLTDAGLDVALREHITSGGAYLGICLGLQTLFEGSEESPGVAGLGVLPGVCAHFPAPPPRGPGIESWSVPHMGWNEVVLHANDGPSSAIVSSFSAGDRAYYVHSYAALPSAANAHAVAATCDYAGSPFIAAVATRGVLATQFHPEKSGARGLSLIRAFLDHALRNVTPPPPPQAPMLWPVLAATGRDKVDAGARPRTRLAARIVACLDVRENDDGDLVVTKGDKYDVREAAGSAAAGGTAAPVRNLGAPVDLVARYYAEGADEVVLLNICAFRGEPLEDAPMLRVLEEASARVFVPLTIGGGIRAYSDAAGRTYSALDVASRYFRAGADKVSIGSDAVAEAEAFWAAGGHTTTPGSSIAAIAAAYGRQAVVVSLDPRRVLLTDAAAEAAAAAAGHTLLPAPPGSGAARCWYQATVRGGREARPIDALRVARAAAALGAGELLVNCVDNDGQRDGYDEVLLSALRAAVDIPLIASSGAGAPCHFSSVFAHTGVEAALAAGIFHRREVAISDVKAHLQAVGIPTVAHRP